MSDTKTPLTYKQRVVIEKAELDVNIHLLAEFVLTDTYMRQVPFDQDILTEQLSAMRKYSDILGIRIARF